MAERTTDPHDDKVRSVPLPSDGADDVVGQENQSAEVALGGGEWPSPDSPPRGPSPGTADDVPRRERPDAVPAPPRGSATAAHLQQDGRAAGDRGPARLADADHGEEGRFPPVKDVLESDPVAAGSASTPDGDGDPPRGTTRYS